MSLPTLRATAAAVLALVLATLPAPGAHAQQTAEEEVLAVPTGGDPCEDRLPAARATLDDFLASIDSRQLNRLFTARDRAVEACASGNSDFAESFVEEFVGLVELALLRQRAAARGELTRAELIEALDHAGFEDISVAQDNREESGTLLIQATDVEGRAVELEVDVRTGDVLRETLATEPVAPGG